MLTLALGDSEKTQFCKLLIDHYATIFADLDLLVPTVPSPAPVDEKKQLGTPISKIYIYIPWGMRDYIDRYSCICLMSI